MRLVPQCFSLVIGIESASVVIDAVAVKSAFGNRWILFVYLVDDPLAVHVESGAALGAVGITVVRKCEPSVSTVADGAREVVAEGFVEVAGADDKPSKSETEVLAQSIKVVVSRTASTFHRYLRHAVHHMLSDAGELSWISHHIE